MEHDSGLNFAISEENYQVGGQINLQLEVFEINGSDFESCVVILKARFEGGELWVDLISNLPGYDGTGIALAIMEDLARRYGRPCLPPGVTTDGEDQIWSLYRLRGPQSPRVGYLTLLPFLPTHFVGQASG